MIAQSTVNGTSDVNQTITVDWDAVYADNLPRVFHFFCYRLGNGDTALAEDLTSITFEKAWRNRHHYRRDEAGFQAWLFTIARNVAVDHFRRAPQADSMDEMEHLASSESIETSLEQKDAYQQLSRLLRTLSARDRELIALKYGLGLPNRRIGELMRMSETHVSTQLSRLVQRLRAQWNRMGDQNDQVPF